MNTRTFELLLGRTLGVGVLVVLAVTVWTAWRQ